MGFTLSCAEVHEESWSSSPFGFAVHSEYLMMTIMVLVMVVMVIMMVMMMMMRVMVSQNT